MFPSKSSCTVLGSLAIGALAAFASFNRSEASSKHPAGGGVASVRSVLAEGGWKCDYNGYCTDCLTCCIDEAAKVRQACVEAGGSTEFCDEQFQNSFGACKQEDCPSICG